MIRILTQSTHLKVFFDGVEPDQVAAAKKILTTKFRAEDSQLKYNYAVRKGFASAFKSFYIFDKDLLPVGFLPYLEYYLKQEKIKYEVIDLRKYPKVDKDFLRSLAAGNYKTKNGFIPRDFQIKAVIKLFQNKSGGIVQLPMGSGKSFIAFLITKVYPTSKILLMFDQIELVHQTRKMFIEYGMPAEEIGIIQGNNFQDDRRVTLLSVDSYEKAFHLFPFIKVIICDECDQLGSDTEKSTATKVLYSCQNAPVRIGLSATADAIDNPYRQMGLFGNLGPIVYNKQIKEHVDDGTLADLEIEMHIIDHDPIPICGSYADIYEWRKITKEINVEQMKKFGWEEALKNKVPYLRKFVNNGDESTHYVFNEIRNKKIVEIIKNQNRVLILFIRQEHGKILKELLPDSLMVMGKDDKKTREAAKNYLKENKKGIVLASNIFGRGVDIPWIQTLVLVGGGKGTQPVIQRFGRATRKHAGTQKTKAKIIDFYDKFSPLGEKQSKQRKLIYEKKLGFKVNIIN